MTNATLFTLCLGLVVGLGFFVYKAITSENEQQQSYSRNPLPQPDSDWSSPWESQESSMESQWSGDYGTKCPICQGYVVGDDRQLACGHTFHFRCIGKWLDTKGLAMTKFCPMCREPIKYTRDEICIGNNNIANDCNSNDLSKNLQ